MGSKMNSLLNRIYSWALPKCRITSSATRFHGGLHRYNSTLQTSQTRPAEHHFAVNEDHLEVKMSHWHDTQKLHLRWLRDSCRCDQCRESASHLRLASPDSGLHDTVNNVALENDHLTISWSDGHQTVFDANLLYQLVNGLTTSTERQTKKTLWNSAIAAKLGFAQVNYEDFMARDSDLQLVMNSLLDYGIAIINKVPVTSENTRLAMERFGPIWRTFWGEFYYVVADLKMHSHPSYTGGDLHLHNDTNYYFEGAGIQAFHVLEHKGTGGVNKFADGFFVANVIRTQHPEVYEYLSSKPISFKYKAAGKLHLVNEDLLLKHDPVTKELIQIRYTPYDLDVFRTIPHQDIENHYTALDVLKKEINRPENAHWIHLTPGKLLVTDNWRIFHGRSNFTGKRSLCGMYVSRSDFLSRARKLGLTL